VTEPELRNQDSSRKILIPKPPAIPRETGDYGANQPDIYFSGTAQLGVTVLAFKLPDGQLNTRPGADTVLETPAQILALDTREQLGGADKTGTGVNI